MEVTNIIIQCISSIASVIVTLMCLYKNFIKNTVTKDDLSDIIENLDRLDRKLDNNIEKQAKLCERVAVLEYALQHRLKEVH